MGKDRKKSNKTKRQELKSKMTCAAKAHSLVCTLYRSQGPEIAGDFELLADS